MIPNGTGNWKKTDPTIDKDHILNTNKEKDGRVLELIRICKKWNKVKNAKTLPSYLLETMIINHCDEEKELNQWIDVRFKNALKYIANHILSSVYDMKDIQGNINTLDILDRYTLKSKAQSDYEKACEAIKYETGDFYSTSKVIQISHLFKSKSKDIGRKLHLDVVGKQFPGFF